MILARSQKDSYRSTLPCCRVICRSKVLKITSCGTVRRATYEGRSFRHSDPITLVPISARVSIINENSQTSCTEHPDISPRAQAMHGPVSQNAHAHPYTGDVQWHGLTYGFRLAGYLSKADMHPRNDNMGQHPHIVIQPNLNNYPVGSLV